MFFRKLNKIENANMKKIIVNTGFLIDYNIDYSLFFAQ